MEDILEELEGVKSDTFRTGPRPEPLGLEPDQRRVWEFLGGEPHHLDEMVQQLNLSVAQLSGILFVLEMNKTVRRLPGNRYERAHWTAAAANSTARGCHAHPWGGR